MRCNLKLGRDINVLWKDIPRSWTAERVERKEAEEGMGDFRGGRTLRTDGGL